MPIRKLKEFNLDNIIATKLVFPDFVALKINLFVGMFEENRNLFKLRQVFQAS